MGTSTGMRADDLAARLGGALRHCPPERAISEVRPLEEAGVGAVSFLANAKYAAKARESGAGLILVDTKAEMGDQPCCVVENPYWAFAQAIGLLHPEPAPDFTETPVHPTAKLHGRVHLGPGATVGARSEIGPGCVLHPGVHIGEDCVLGEGCELFPGVVLYRRTKLGRNVRVHANSVLGSDGYGYVLVEGRHAKVPQVGWVEVGDEAEIGACVTVDR
ncbi:MAG TPA: LpxD N-terminal domain-containing protein, partial [Holophagaceae bacterium]|nr:LpxD N-terminal domain-containing protein [Holophagaceae bacterium]